MGEGAKGASPFPLPQTPTPNPLCEKSRGDPPGRPFLLAQAGKAGTRIVQAELGPAGRSQVQLGNERRKVLSTASFLIMCGALGFGALIILGAMWKAKRAESAAKTAGIAVI